MAIDTSALVPVADVKDRIKGGKLLCYRCKTHGVETPAVMCREMRTPNNSVYYRGWCQGCLDGKPVEIPEAVVEEISTNHRNRKFRVGNVVTLTASGKVLGYGVNDKVGFVRVQVGGDSGPVYIVPEDWCAIKGGSDD